MTRRDRLAAKLQRRHEWAQKAENRSNAAFDRVHKLADQIPLGQPILVGHHSQKRAQRDADRITNGMIKGVEERKLAEHHSSKAGGLIDQLDRSIFSDDRDAIEALAERIAEREAKAADMVKLNKDWRKSKGDATVFAELAGISFESAQRIAAAIAKNYSWDQQPYAAYELSNLRSSIRTDKKRLEEIKVRPQPIEIIE